MEGGYAKETGAERDLAPLKVGEDEGYFSRFSAVTFPLSPFSLTYAARGRNPLRAVPGRC